MVGGLGGPGGGERGDPGEREPQQVSALLVQGKQTPWDSFTRTGFGTWNTVRPSGAPRGDPFSVNSVSLPT